MYYKIKVFSTISAARSEAILFKYNNTMCIPKDIVKKCLKRALKTVTPYSLEITSCKHKEHRHVAKTYEELENLVSKVKLYRLNQGFKEVYRNVASFTTDEPRYAFDNVFFKNKWYTFITPQFYVEWDFDSIKQGLEELGIYPVKLAKSLVAFTEGKYIGVYEEGKPWKIQRVSEEYKFEWEELPS